MKHLIHLNRKELKKRENPNENGDLIYYAQLLDKGHSEGLKGISTKLLQIPSKENQFTAIMVARICTNRGVFTGHGDASPINVDPEIAPHIIRMAETRAKARALRDAVNIGTVAIEELGETTEKKGNDYEKKLSDPNGLNEKKKEKENSVGDQKENNTEKEKEPLMTERQRSFLFRLLAEKGLVGDVAHEGLKKAFKVTALKEVSRHQAKGMIEKLLKKDEVEEGGA